MAKINIDLSKSFNRKNFKINPLMIGAAIGILLLIVVGIAVATTLANIAGGGNYDKKPVSNPVSQVVVVPTSGKCERIGPKSTGSYALRSGVVFYKENGKADQEIKADKLKFEYLVSDRSREKLILIGPDPIDSKTRLIHQYIFGECSFKLIAQQRLARAKQPWTNSNVGFSPKMNYLYYPEGSALVLYEFRNSGNYTINPNYRNEVKVDATWSPSEKFILFKSGQENSYIQRLFKKKGTNYVEATLPPGYELNIKSIPSYQSDQLLGFVSDVPIIISHLTYVDEDKLPASAPQTDQPNAGEVVIAKLDVDTAELTEIFKLEGYYTPNQVKIIANDKFNIGSTGYQVTEYLTVSKR